MIELIKEVRELEERVYKLEESVECFSNMFDSQGREINRASHQLYQLLYKTNSRQVKQSILRKFFSVFGKKEKS